MSIPLLAALTVLCEGVTRLWKPKRCDQKPKKTKAADKIRRHTMYDAYLDDAANLPPLLVDEEGKQTLFDG